MKKSKISEYLPVLALGLGAFFIYKFFFSKSDTEATAEDVVTDQDQKIKELSKIYKATYPNDYYGTLANSIYNSIAYSGIADNYKQTFNLMLKIMNPLDLALLIRAYGVRQRYTFGIPSGYPEDLLTSVSNELRSEIISNPFGASKVDLINKWFKEHNIKEQI